MPPASRMEPAIDEKGDRADNWGFDGLTGLVADSGHHAGLLDEGAGDVGD